MKPPEHHFVNEYGQREVKRLWLGSGVKDKNGKEIFEGDAVLLDNRLGVVRFDNAQFYIDRDGDENVPFTLNRLCSPFIEVVGHVEEETNDNRT